MAGVAKTAPRCLAVPPRGLIKEGTMQENTSRYADSLAAPVPRTHVHTRDVQYRGYRREDGLWDIEAELTDTKTYEASCQPARPCTAW